MSPTPSLPTTTSSDFPPIDKLPSELMIAILVLVAAQQPSMKAQELFPLTTQGVCRRWRDITRSAHELWTKLHVQTSGVIPPHKQYLKRSGSRHLHVYLEADTDDTSWLDRTALVWSRFLEENSHRIWKLQIGLSAFGSETPRRILEDLPGGFNNLLEFSAFSLHSEDEWGRAKESVWPKRIVLPRLRSLHLEDFALRSWIPLIPSCQNLKELHIVDPFVKHTGVPTSEISALLHSSPNLQILEIENHGTDAPIDLKTATLEQLHTLTICNAEQGDLRLFFNLLSAPNLTSLTVIGEPDSEGHSYNDGPPLPLKFPSLEVLSLHHTPAAFKIATQLSPFVRHLHFTQANGDHTFADLRQHWRTCKEVLPLETLTTSGVPARILRKTRALSATSLPMLSEIVDSDSESTMSLSNNDSSTREEPPDDLKENE